MKATFRTDSPHILCEAEAGDLFVSLGPDLVECVCAMRCHAAEGYDGVFWPHDGTFQPSTLLDVVVLACRVGKGEPEYYPPGHNALLPAATPIVFLEQVEALALRPRDAANAMRHDEWLPLTAQLVNLTRFDHRQWPQHHGDVTRPELASRL